MALAEGAVPESHPQRHQTPGAAMVMNLQSKKKKNVGRRNKKTSSNPTHEKGRANWGDKLEKAKTRLKKKTNKGKEGSQATRRTTADKRCTVKGAAPMGGNAAVFR